MSLFYSFASFFIFSILVIVKESLYAPYPFPLPGCPPSRNKPHRSSAPKSLFTRTNKRDLERMRASIDLMRAAAASQRARRGGGPVVVYPVSVCAPLRIVGQGPRPPRSRALHSSSSFLRRRSLVRDAGAAAAAAADAVVSRHRQMTSNGYFKNDAVFVRVVSKYPIMLR